MSAQLKVTLESSAIRSTAPQLGTLRALGLKKRGSSNILPDRPEIRGMILRVKHLVKVEPVATTGKGV